MKLKIYSKPITCFETMVYIYLSDIFFANGYDDALRKRHFFSLNYYIYNIMKSDIVESFSQMVKDKKMDRDVLESIIKDVFGIMIKKKYGQNTNFDVIVNMDKGDIEMYLTKSVVETVADPETEIDPESASEKSGEELGIGDDYVEVIDFPSFGRRHIVNLKQNLNQKIREIEKEIV